VEWLDAQPFLARVCDGMRVGELLHTEEFSLFDSMTAIEIGDIKMDIGMRRDEEVGTAEDLIAQGNAPLDLLPRQLLAVMDRLLVLEATWHTGSMLPQTVFTSLYMLQIDRCPLWGGGGGRGSGCRLDCGESEQAAAAAAHTCPACPARRLSEWPALHAFCLGMRSACTAAVDCITSAQVCEASRRRGEGGLAMAMCACTRNKPQIKPTLTWLLFCICDPGRGHLHSHIWDADSGYPRGGADAACNPGGQAHAS
jgi:hypothetical protein